jgi:hypothetical protein
MGKHAFNAIKPLPAEFIQALRSPATRPQLAQAFGVKLGVISYWRKRLQVEGAEALMGERTGYRRAPSQQAPRMSRRARARAVNGVWSLTPRVEEVLARLITPYTLAELVRESPRGACVVCWKDVRSEETLACYRVKPDALTTPCSSYVQRAKAVEQAAHEVAKASLLGEVAHG